jgi:dolichol-phosphate mannosyltransferase
MRAVAENVFVVPAYNEVENLPRLLADLEARPSLFPEGSRLIIVDDGSQDGTAELVDGYAGPLPAEVLRLGRNQGPGAAFRAGFAAALEHCAPEALVVTLEADSTGDLDALP